MPAGSSSWIVELLLAEGLLAEAAVRSLPDGGMRQLAIGIGAAAPGRSTPRGLAAALECGELPDQRPLPGELGGGGL